MTCGNRPPNHRKPVSSASPTIGTVRLIKRWLSRTRERRARFIPLVAPTFRELTSPQFAIWSVTCPFLKNKELRARQTRRNSPISPTSEPISLQLVRKDRFREALWNRFRWPKASSPTVLRRLTSLRVPHGSGWAMVENKTRIVAHWVQAWVWSWPNRLMSLFGSRLRRDL